MPRTLKVRSYAKVNLGLEVLGLRADGYHELRTLFQTIALHDDLELTLRARDPEITVECDHPAVPRDGSNLAAKAAELVQRYTKTTKGVHIAIRKRIPVAGGLGGGSSNAAAVLLGLRRLWGLPDAVLPASVLHRLAGRLGADVPFFLVGGTALGLARGDEVFPLWRQLRGHVVVVDPGVPLSTAAVFRRLDANLTPREDTRTIFRFVTSELAGQENALRVLTNDLEQAALEEAPGLARLFKGFRGILVREGARHCALSGSGAAFFGLFDSADGARRAHAALSAAGHRVSRSRTLSLGQYQRAMSHTTGPRSARSGIGDRGRSGHHGDHGRQGDSG